MISYIDVRELDSNVANKASVRHREETCQIRQGIVESKMNEYNWQVLMAEPEVQDLSHEKQGAKMGI